MHSFTDIFIRRPVFASALSFMLLVSGLAAFYQMPVRQFPLIETNVVTVTTTYPGASAELMAGFVSTPLENAIGSIDGIDYMTSSSVQNTSQITVNFLLGYPIETGVTDVSNQVSSVRYMLPKQIQDPIISKSDPNASPTVYLSFSSETLDSEAVTDFLLRVIQPQLGTMEGVSQAQILGEREYAMRINLDTQRMTALNVTASEVMDALRLNNLQAAAGSVEAQLQVYQISANTDLTTPDQFNNLVIKAGANGYLIRIRDIGTAVLGAASYSSSAVMNGESTTVIGIIPSSDANPLAVSKETDKILPSIRKQLPADIKVDVIYDSSVFIEESIIEVYKTMIEASIFVVIVIYLFLGSFRSVIIPIVTIPVSLIGVCGIMLALNYTINTITLLAWVLAIGLVVDDAIVVLENIHRHMEEGLSPIPASIIGAREIAFAVIAMTITLAAVYAPIGFTGGLTGIMFSEFAFTLSAAVIVSGFIALTLSPMMCSRILRYEHNKKGFSYHIDNTFNKLMVKYKQMLVRVIDSFRWVVLLGGLLLYIAFFYLFLTIPQELAPTEDQGVLFGYIIGPSSSNILFTEKYTAELSKVYEAVPEMASYGIINGYPNAVNSAIAFLSLVNWGDRTRTANEISRAIFPKMWAIPGLKIIPVAPPPLPSSGSFMPLQFAIKNADGSATGIARLNYAMNELMFAASKNPAFTGMDADIKLDMPQTFVNIDRNKAGDLGVSAQTIASTLNVMYGQPEDVQFSIQGRGYYVIPELDKNFNFTANPKTIDDVYVRSSSGSLVPLSNIVTIEDKVVPLSLNHFQQLPSATLSANIAPGTLGIALKFLEEFMTANFPDLQYDFAAQARQYVQAQSAMVYVLIFALIFIFLVLAAQFESYRDPIIVLGVVPLTLAGALIALRLGGGTSNIYSQVGFTTLVGLIAKHGILITEFANQLQEKGMDRTKAVIEAASLRLRPILMTTGAMVLGAMPLAVASGAGAQARHQIGIVIVGGMTIGTLFSLLVVPTLYSLMAKIRVRDDKLENEIAEAIAISAKAEQDARDARDAKE